MHILESKQTSQLLNFRELICIQSGNNIIECFDYFLLLKVYHDPTKEKSNTIEHSVRIPRHVKQFDEFIFLFCKTLKFEKEHDI